MIRPNPSRQVLQETPTRALRFLRGRGPSLITPAPLARRGYDAVAHKRGWELLHETSGYREEAPVVSEDASVRDALVEVDAWDEPNFRIAHGALVLSYPD